MKFTAYLCVGMLIAITILSVMPIHGEEQIYDSMIRLHVIANSDSQDDQAIKLEVRDAVIEYMQSIENQNDNLNLNKDETAIILESQLGIIKSIADEIISEKGYASQAVLGYENYPTRYYEDIELPAGKYLSLRIILGSGEGKNWWCVLFPPLCLSGSVKADIETDADEMEAFISAGLTSEQYRIIKGEKTPTYKIKFKILEILSGVLGIEY